MNAPQGIRFCVAAMVAGCATFVLSSCGGGGGGDGGTPGAPVAGFEIAQQAYVKSSNSQAEDTFGRAVAMDGDILVVSALGEDSIDGNPINNGGSNVGAVYVFVRSGGAWTEQAYLKPSNPDNDDQFGASLALSGDTLVVGAPAEASNSAADPTDNTAAFSGAAYVFVRNGSTWTQQAYLKASNIGGLDRFGESVAIDGDTVAVGAPSEDGSAQVVNGPADDGRTDSGAVYVFVRNGVNWTQEAYVKASNAGMSDSFGWSVALSGDTLAVGAILEDSNLTGVNASGGADTSMDSGAVYVFTRSAGTWSQQAYVKPSNTEQDAEFGYSAALSGDTLAVGSRFEGSGDNGAAYVFVRIGTTWSEQALLRASNAGDGDGFGTSIALSGDLLAVGAPFEDGGSSGVGGNQADNSLAESGATYVFQRSGGTWSQQGYVKASNTDLDDRFGSSLALSGTTLAVGAVRESSIATGIGGNQADDSASNSGAAYVFAP